MYYHLEFNSSLKCFNAKMRKVYRKGRRELNEKLDSLKEMSKRYKSAKTNISIIFIKILLCFLMIENNTIFKKRYIYLLFYFSFRISLFL